MLFHFVKDIVVYMVLLSFLKNLAGENVYRKYLDLYGGLVLILILLNAVVGIDGKPMRVEELFTTNVEQIEGYEAFAHSKPQADFKRMEDLQQQIAKKMENKAKMAQKKEQEENE
ncbi:MAG: stage III sporulation protein AF [Lachnospiraceae bacterium]|nr:stage III sporulation protein AF [Lachnospiraceae bacterium]